MRLIFESPAPLTSAIPCNARMALATSSWFSGLTPTTISKSPIVSLRRRALPASWTRSTPGSALILCSNAVPYFNPISKRRRARKRERSSIPSSMRCSDFFPNPFIGAIRPCSAASLSAAMESTPNSSCINLIRFGPSPGIPSISIIPCGVSSCKRTQSSGQTPSKIA